MRTNEKLAREVAAFCQLPREGRRPAKRVGVGKLYYMLSNPIYVGKTRHRGRLYVGEHRPIIAHEVFSAVQTRLADQAPRARGLPAQRDVHILNGLLFDETGDRLSPILAKKAGKRYRYYISSRLKQGQPAAPGGWRLPAKEIEEIVICQLRSLFSDTSRLSGWLLDLTDTSGFKVGLDKAAKLVGDLAGPMLPERLREIVHLAVQRIELASEFIRLIVHKTAVVTWLAGAAPTGASADGDHDCHVIDLPLTIRKRGVEQRLVIEGQGASSVHVDQPMIETVARANLYVADLAKGDTRAAIAKRYGVHPEDVSRLLPVAFLSPSIVNAILTGRQPTDLSVRDLTRRMDLPLNWAEQGQLLSI